MKKFFNILYVSVGLGDETAALKQAFSVARNNKAFITALVVALRYLSFGEYDLSSPRHRLLNF